MFKKLSKTTKAFFEHQMRISKEKMKDELVFYDMTHLHNLIEHDNVKMDEFIEAHYTSHDDSDSSILYTLIDNDDYDDVETILIAKTMTLYIKTKDDILVYNIFYNVYRCDNSVVKFEIGMKNTADGILDIERFHPSIDTFQSWDTIIGIIVSDIMDNYLYKIDAVIVSRILDVLTGYNTNIFDRNKMYYIIKSHLEKYKNTNRIDIYNT